MTSDDKMQLSDEIAKAAIKQYGVVIVDGVPVHFSKMANGDDGYVADPQNNNGLLFSSPARALWSYRRLLKAEQYERDAKDAPRLREENERMRELLLRWCQSSSDAYFGQLIKESQAALKGAQA